VTYVEVLPPELTGPAHPEWFAERAKGVTASEIVAVLGISPWESPFSLYWRKRGTLGEQADNEQMRWGRRLERHIADEFAERHAEFSVMPAGLYAHADRPWQMASPDGLLYDMETSGVVERDGVFYIEPIAALECKTTGSWDGWGADGSDEIPLHYRAQVIWQADVLGVPCVYVPVVNGRTYREYVVQADPEDAALMRKAAEQFMAAVRDGNPPDVDGSTATLTALKTIHADLDDTEARVPGGLAADYRRAVRGLRKADARKKTVEARLRGRMGRARIAVDPHGDKVATRSVYEVKEHVRAASKVDKLILPKETP
jgi:putative phage-type endonuclease